MAAYFDALLRYFEFSGRSSRRQLWYFWLTTAVICGAAGALDLFGMSWQANPVQPGFFLTFAIIFHFVPNVTLTVRRLHDIGRSGWWWWLSCVPLGDLVLFVWTGFFASEPGENQYGEQERGGRQASSGINYERALRRPGTGTARIATSSDGPQRFI